MRSGKGRQEWTRGRRVSKRSLDGEDGKGATTGRCAAKAVRREVVSAEMKMYGTRFSRVIGTHLILSLRNAVSEGGRKRGRKRRGRREERKREERGKEDGRNMDR